MDELEWDVRVPLVSNVYVLIDILMVLIVVSGGLAGLVLYLTGFEDLYGVLRLFLIADGFVIILLYSVMGFVFLNRFQLLYRVDMEGVEVRVGEFESSLNRIAWRVSSLVQKYSFTGGRVYSLVNEQHSVSWDDVYRFSVDQKHRLITLTSRIRPLMRVYCGPENFDNVLGIVEEIVPEPE